MHQTSFFTVLVILFIIWTTMERHASANVVHVVTWNVNDNSKMRDGYSDSAMDKVLGLDSAKSLADIYAIGLQENCWECNERSFPKIGDKFLGRIKKKSSNYEVVHIEATRESRWCEWLCNFGTHGSTILVVIAKQNLIRSFNAFHRNDDCSDATPQNDEKGVAAIKMALSNGKSVCFGTAHLESGDSTTRRQCLKLFFQDALKNGWDSCDYQFIFGDFNARTGGKISGASDNGKYLSPSDSSLRSLKERDEFTGVEPYGTDSTWKKNLTAFINQVQRSNFLESPLKFMPTYSVRPANECEGRKTCYRASRPISWTDRIIYTKGEVVKYDCIKEYYGDHFPVFGIFKLN